MLCVGAVMISAAPLSNAYGQAGGVDAGFAPGAGVDQSVYAIAAQADGKILIGGYFTQFDSTARTNIARLNNNGTLDSGFNPGMGTDDQVNVVALQTNRVIVGGYFTMVNGTNAGHIARLHSHGGLDTSFDPGSGADGPVLAVQVQSDGKILVGGEFSNINGTPRNNIARLNSNGSLDMTFDPGTGVSSTTFPSVKCIAVQTDGGIVIGGAFTHVNGSPRNNIARLNASGSLDDTFGPSVDLTGAGVLAGVYALAIQSDGKLLIAGDFTGVNTTPRTNIARLNSTGLPDSSFNPGAGLNAPASSIALQVDGRAIVGGYFSRANGVSRTNIARLNTDGAVDASFLPGMGANDAIYATVLQSDGKVLIGGVFTSYDNTSRPGIARLQGNPVIVPPQLVNPAFSNNAFKVSLSTVTGVNYYLEYKTNSITDSTWTALPSVVGDGTMKTLVDPAAVGPRRFYRVRVQ
jgi:uncharacterized delta-60 repeat protein